MRFENKIAAFVVFVMVFREGVGDQSSFRVLAPEFVCPNDEEALIEKPDNIVITVKTDVADLQLSWLVRWSPLRGPSHRFTLLLWKTVRALEAKLNALQPEPFVYVIEHSELLQGVEYIFNVTASEPDSLNTTTKLFAIDNIKGDPKLLIEGQSEKLSVLLIGAGTVYADMEYVTEAEVTTCSPTQDYYFTWSVQSASARSLNVSGTAGSRLELARYSLRAGTRYYVGCTVYRNSGEFVTQTSLPFQVLFRGLTVNLSLDVLVVTVNYAFDLKALVDNQDYYGEVLEFEWICLFENEPCNSFESVNGTILNFLHGLPNLGRYEISLVASIKDQRASANATVYVVEPTLPVIHAFGGGKTAMFVPFGVETMGPWGPAALSTLRDLAKRLVEASEPQPRLVNEHSIVKLVANASNVAPSCTLTWYFANAEELASFDYNDTCATEDCLLGEALSGSVTILSLEENFLNEITDFSNETEWRQVVAEINAAAGRARFIAQCGCSLTFSCDTQGTVHADVNFDINKSPEVADIKVTPETGTALETIFRLSTLAASDSDKPLLYSFFCGLGTNITLLLGSNLEQLAVETLLPYIDPSGTNVWVEVCDSLGACSTSELKSVQLLEGEGRTVQAILNSIRGHLSRCEMMQLQRVVKLAVTTYTNTNQADVLTIFKKSLLEVLPTAEEQHCIKRKQGYSNLLDWLTEMDLDIKS